MEECCAEKSVGNDEADGCKIDSSLAISAGALAVPRGVRRSPRIAARRAATSSVKSLSISVSNLSNSEKSKTFSKVQRSSSMSMGSCISDSEFDTSLSPILREKDDVDNQANRIMGNTFIEGHLPLDLEVFTAPKVKQREKRKKKKRMSITSISSLKSIQDESMGFADSSMMKKRKRKKRRSDVDDDDDDDDDSELSFFQSFKRKKRKNGDEENDNLSVKSFSLRSSFQMRRKSRPDLDTLSLQSFTMGSGNKRNRTMVRVGSLANILSPVTKKVGQALQRSMSFKGTPGGVTTVKPYCKPQATPTKRRDSKLWSETVQGNINEALTKIEIKRQEAIFELFQGEVDLVDDLYLVMKAYHDAMKSLQILTSDELNIIFGSLNELRQLHEDLLCELQNQKRKNGTTEAIGQVLLNWLPTLREVYVAYCTNQLAAKSLLDEKKQDSKVNDFLERCIESPFSRKLDLWNFLDVPRSRLVKYPLLMKNILRVTPSDHMDKTDLPNAIQLCEEILSEVDRRTGETKCKHYIDHLEFLDEKQKNHLLPHQKVLLCGGVLKNTKGTKLHVFLFEDIMVVTRSVMRNGQQRYQVYRQPIPVRTMALDDIPDGEVKRSGSFRGALSTGTSVKYGFKVRSTNANLSQSFTLYSSDEHDKKQWLQLIRGAIKRARQDETSI